MQNYRDLVVWKKSIELVKHIYAASAKFPKDQLYVLTSQLQRSALSVPSNIAEGRSRHSEKEFVYYLNVAKGSLAEVETQIIVSTEVGYMNKTEQSALLDETNEIGKMLHGLINSLRSIRAETCNLEAVS